MIIIISFYPFTHRIIELCTLTPKGITDDVIKAAVPQCDIQQRVIAVNRLLSTVSISSPVLSTLMILLLYIRWSDIIFIKVGWIVQSPLKSFMQA